MATERITLTIDMKIEAMYISFSYPWITDT
jgi:hypothetical protein